MAQHSGGEEKRMEYFSEEGCEKELTEKIFEETKKNGSHTEQEVYEVLCDIGDKRMEYLQNQKEYQNGEHKQCVKSCVKKKVGVLGYMCGETGADLKIKGIVKSLTEGKITETATKLAGAALCKLIKDDNGEARKECESECEYKITKHK